MEADGSTQTVATAGDVAFSADPSDIDIVGGDITVNAAGTEFTIHRAGLYQVTWSVNQTAQGDPILLGISENGAAASAHYNSASQGSYSSGSLIQVEEGDLPFVITLRNYGAPIDITNPDNVNSTAVSIRITRFADGEA